MGAIPSGSASDDVMSNFNASTVTRVGAEGNPRRVSATPTVRAGLPSKEMAAKLDCRWMGIADAGKIAGP